jgi:signal transduction histidine kinase
MLVTAPNKFWLAAMVGVAYFLTSRLGLAFVVQPEGIAGIWPASGLMLAVLVSTPRHSWAASIAGMMVANVSANLISGSSVIVSLGFAAANALEPLAAALLLKRFWGIPLTFTRLRDVVGLVLVAAGCSNLLTSFVGAAVSSLSFGAPFFDVWRVWWIADGLGMLVTAPALLTWRHARDYLLPSLTPLRLLELIGAFLLLATTTQLVFGQSSDLLRNAPYLVFPLLLWIAVRFGPAATSYALVIVTAISIANTINSMAANHTPETRFLLETQLFLGVAAISKLALAAIMTERRLAEANLRESEARYRDLAARYAQTLEQAQLYEGERRARLAAEEADKLKLQFLAMISHELRTPLTSIKGFITTLLAQDIEIDPPTQRKFLNIADEETDRLQDLISQLLDLSQMQAGTLRINPQPSSVYRILEAAQPQLETVSANHSLKVYIESSLPPIQADQSRIVQVLSNLVQNAAKYSPTSSPITVTVEQEAQFVRFNVRDEGKGIPIELQKAAFEAFRQLQTNGKGIGLGLAICKGLVEAHGGRIWVDDRVGTGTTMSFTLPTIQENGSRS